MDASARPGSVREVARVFGTLGVIAFGGPAAHIALMREEIVRRRRWVTDERFRLGRARGRRAAHRFRVNSAWLAIAGGALGIVYGALVG